jgi:hypothetical protein
MFYGKFIYQKAENILTPDLLLFVGRFTLAPKGKEVS